MLSQNPFQKFVSSYSDEEIMHAIDEPSDLDTGVYEAVLFTAKERRLISEEEYRDFMQSSDIPAESEADQVAGKVNEEYWKCPSCREVIEMEFDRCWKCQAERPASPEHPGLNELPEDPEEIEEAGKERYKYWKCPVCHQTVDMELDVCWNCQKEKPVNIEHPGKREMLEEIKGTRNFNPFRSGFILIAIGIFVFVLEYYIFPARIHFGRMIMAGFLAVMGLFFLTVGTVQNRKKE